MSTFEQVKGAQVRLARIDEWLAEGDERGYEVERSLVHHRGKSSIYPPHDLAERLRRRVEGMLPQLLAEVRSSFAEELRQAAMACQAEIGALAKGDPVPSQAPPKGVPTDA